MYKLIIFDLGGVITDYSEFEYYAYLSSKYNIPLDKIERTLEPMIAKLESSRITLREFESRASRALNLTRKSLDWSKAFERLAGTNPQTQNLVRRLRKRYQVVLLSNITRSRYEVASTKFFSPSLFDRVFVSYAIRMRKPEARIYRYVLHHMHVRASEALFIDNQPENIESAMRVGIRSILFTNYKALERELRHIGVIN